LNQKLREKIMESLSAVLPITGIVLVLSILLVPLKLSTMFMFLTGAIMLVVGMGFFQLGVKFDSIAGNEKFLHTDSSSIFDIFFS